MLLRVRGEKTIEEWEMKAFDSRQIPRLVPQPSVDLAMGRVTL